MPLSPKKSPTLFAHSPSKTLTKKNTHSRSRSSRTKHDYSIANLFIRKSRHQSPSHSVDAERGLLAEEDADDITAKEKGNRLVCITIAMFATLGIGACIVSLAIATGVVEGTGI